MTISAVRFNEGLALCVSPQKKSIVDRDSRGQSKRSQQSEPGCPYFVKTLARAWNKKYDPAAYSDAKYVMIKHES
jgi:hypothetical protein